MREMLQELRDYRELLFMMAWRDIKIRYKQSVMGFFWAILMPMLVVCAGILVKKAFSMLSGSPMQLRDLVTVSVKALPWSFFVSALRFSTNSMVGNMNLITKIYFPREVFPLSAVLASLFDFGVAASTLLLFLIAARIGLSPHLVWVPYILLCLVLLVSGLGMLLSCANTFFRDVKYLVEVFLTFGIFFTPVFYEVDMFPRWRTLLLLNPLAGILEDLNRTVVLHQGPDLAWMIYYSTWALLGFLGAWRLFHEAEFRFAEVI